MKLTSYFKDKILIILINLLAILLIIFLLLAFKVSIFLTLMVSFILIINSITIFFFDYFRKKNFYLNLINNLDRLDKKYLVMETIDNPSFYEGKLIKQILYETDKSMLEEIDKYKLNLEDFKDYIEMWIHEVKMPLATLMLMTHNHKEMDNKYLFQLKGLDNYLDQILYYVRSNYLEEDFTFQTVSLDKVISRVALKNKDDLLENNIDFIVNTNSLKVVTDYKWLEFILNQVINNSIKYKRNIKNSYIKIDAFLENDKIKLTVLDNGWGISKNDLPKVFNKSFTGSNGIYNSKSTGMGLYIAKKLCDKLGHKLEIESTINSYTLVTITFGINDFYNNYSSITKL